MVDSVTPVNEIDYDNGRKEKNWIVNRMATTMELVKSGVPS